LSQFNMFFCYWIGSWTHTQSVYKRIDCSKQVSKINKILARWYWMKQIGNRWYIFNNLGFNMVCFFDSLLFYKNIIIKDWASNNTISIGFCTYIFINSHTLTLSQNKMKKKTKKKVNVIIANKCTYVYCLFYVINDTVTISIYPILTSDINCSSFF